MGGSSEFLQNWQGPTMCHEPGITNHRDSGLTNHRDLRGSGLVTQVDDVSRVRNHEAGSSSASKDGSGVNTRPRRSTPRIKGYFYPMCTRFLCPRRDQARLMWVRGVGPMTCAGLPPPEGHSWKRCSIHDPPITGVSSTTVCRGKSESSECSIGTPEKYE